MITSCIPDFKTVVQRRGVETTLSTAIHTYNNMMGSVDWSDQMTTSYPIAHKQIKKWYQKQFMHLTNISSFNAQIMQKKKGGKLDTLNFYTKLVVQIFKKYATKVKSSVKCRGRRPRLEENPFHLTEKHFLILIPPTWKKDKPTRCCIVCHKQKQQKDQQAQSCTYCWHLLWLEIVFNVFHIWCEQGTNMKHF